MRTEGVKIADDRAVEVVFADEWGRRDAGLYTTAILCGRKLSAALLSIIMRLDKPEFEALLSSDFVLLMISLMRSFCILLCSGLPHHTGRLYSHLTDRFVHAPQEG
jgi:hypothetical protein